jgi:iron complex outermembrane receptor protein
LNQHGNVALFWIADDLLDDSTNTAQAYAQYDWKATREITVSPGLRYSSATRSLNAAISKTSPPAPAAAKATYDAWLPSISIHDRLDPHWSAYAQAAQGFLAPPVNVIYTNGSQSLKPELTTNYQVGTAYATREFTFGADVYYIDFSNYIGTATVATDSGNESLYVNAGGAVYKGVEVEGTVAITPKLSTYGNLSYNQANYKSGHVQVAATPRWTAALGLIYGGQQGPFGSLMGKVVSSQYGVDNDTDSAGNTVFANSERIGGYMTADAAVGYRAEHGPWGTRDLSISLDVNNLFDTHKVTAYAGTQSVSGTPLYFGLSGRGVFVDLSFKL